MAQPSPSRWLSNGRRSRRTNPWLGREFKNDRNNEALWGNGVEIRELSRLWLAEHCAARGLPGQGFGARGDILYLPTTNRKIGLLFREFRFLQDWACIACHKLSTACSPLDTRQFWRSSLSRTFSGCFIPGGSQMRPATPFRAPGKTDFSPSPVLNTSSGKKSFEFPAYSNRCETKTKHPRRPPACSAFPKHLTAFFPATTRPCSL